MEYLKKKIFNKTQLALSIGMNPSLFDAKLNRRNYNRFSFEEREKIVENMAKMIKNSELNRLMILDFVENLSVPAIDLLKAGYFDYVVDSYLNKLNRI